MMKTIQIALFACLCLSAFAAERKRLDRCDAQWLGEIQLGNKDDCSADLYQYNRNRVISKCRLFLRETYSRTALQSRNSLHASTREEVDRRGNLLLLEGINCLIVVENHESFVVNNHHGQLFTFTNSRGQQLQLPISL
jgi:hypothetical protein